MLKRLKGWLCALGAGVVLALSGCGGSGEPGETPPEITRQPAALTVTSPQAATFTVAATGASTLSYQWLRNGVAIAGATGASHTTAATLAADDGAVYSVRVDSSGGTSTTSAEARLTVWLMPAVTSAPRSGSITDGAAATLSVVASGTPPLRYQWRRNAVDLPGATAASYTTVALGLSDTGTQYSVVVSNPAGSVTSASAVVSVNPAPVALTAQPAAVTTSEGQSATFSVVATGSLPISYQWLLNGTDIPSATSAIYSTPALGIGNSGGAYSVRVSNVAGPVVSSGALLTVTALPHPPVINAAPTAQTVVEGQAATFSVAATGDPVLAYQWLRGGVVIAGATASSYTLSPSTLADNAAQFSVRITNPVANVTSAAVGLTVQAYPSPLDGRAWSAAQSLEENTSALVVKDRKAAIDDAGNVTVVFRKNNGTRDVLYATRGTPNGAGVAPSWSPAVVIDLLGATALSVDAYRTSDSWYTVTAAPSGDVVATWLTFQPCTTATYLGVPTSGCWYQYLARFRPATGWEAPVLVTDVALNGGALALSMLDLRMNDRGDIVLQGNGWERSGATSYTVARAFYYRMAGETGFRRQLFQSEPFGTFFWDLDGAGNLLLGAELARNATTDIISHRGSVAAGFSFANGQVLDTRASAATLRWVRAGVNGHQLLGWDQNNGTRSSLYAATSASATGGFTLTDVSASMPAGYVYVTVSDAGQAYVFNTHFSGPNGARLSWSSSAGWSPAAVNLPAGFPRTESGFGQGHVYSFSRDGNALALQASGGSTATYDAKRNQMVTTWPTAASFSSQVLGFSVSVGPSEPLLAANGVGFSSLRNTFDVLPTVAAPNGDGRGVANLWGVYLK
jgi:hypothetical protein